MKVWEYRSYRREWQIVSQPVDQYGENNGNATVLAAWPTYEDAVIDRPNWGIEHEYNVRDRFVPKVGNDGYSLILIDYKEVEVPYIPGK